MNLLDLLEALIKLGLPMVALSWFIFSWLYGSGEIDRDADRKAISARLKKMKKSFNKDATENPHFIFGKWMKFGGGFYGLAGLWTFAVIEILDFFRFVFYFPGIAQLLEDVIISFVVSFLINQFGNVISAFLWFSYWPAESILLWILIAYLGYWTGVELARRNVEIPIEQWLQKLPIKKTK